MLNANINNISLTKEPKSIIIRDTNFQLEKNKIYSILGKNGSGKTTLIKALTNLLDEEEYLIDANVVYNNESILELHDNKLTQLRENKIKYVFQDALNSFDPLKTFRFYFDKISVDKNITEELIDFFLLPKLDKIIKMHSYEVSIGMAQRIAIIIALLASPEIIILDEPTSAVDVTIANLISIKLKEQAVQKKCTILIITQDILFAENVSDYTAILDNKTLAEFSPVI